MSIPPRPLPSHGVSFCDAHYLRPGLATSWLVVEGGRGAIVETGTPRSVPRVLQALEAQGLDPGDVDWVIVTHVHLDHAGGAGALLQRLPNARLLVHPRGARHLVDPSKLMAGTTAVYGEEYVSRVFGEVVPAPAERVVEGHDDRVVELAGRPLRCLDTPGHAKHHLCLWDEESRGWFTGDTFGLSYPELDTEHGAFVFPTTTPVQLDPPALHASVDRLMARDPEVMYLTHFGPAGDPGRLADDNHRLLDAFVAAADRLAAAEDRHPRLAEELTSLLVARLRERGSELDEPAIRGVVEMDLELCVQGLEIWLERR